MADFSPETLKVALIGAGNMGTAVAKGLLDAKLVKPANLACASPSGGNAAAFAAYPGATCTTSNVAAVTGADVIILAVKPAYMDTVCRQVGSVNPGAMYISLAAGTKMAAIEASLRGNSSTVEGVIASPSFRIVRVMPNLPCSIGAGAAGLCGNKAATADDVGFAVRAFACVGVAHQVTEAQLDAVTGLAGSGPAFVALMVEALADGGVLAGLPRGVAQSLALSVVQGTAALLQQSGQHPAALKDAVASPGGTTIAGIAALEKEGFRGAVMGAVAAASARATELGRGK